MVEPWLWIKVSVTFLMKSAFVIWLELGKAWFQLQIYINFYMTRINTEVRARRRIHIPCCGGGSTDPEIPTEGGLSLRSSGRGGGGRERFICGLSFDNYHTPKGRENKAREVTRIVWFVLGRISFVKMRWKQRAKVMTIYYILFQTLNLYYKYFMYWYLLIYLYIVIFSNYHLTCLRYRSWRHIRALSTLPCPSFVSKENFEDLG